ncbi:hypothetical protein B0I03_105201 [Flavobacterium aquaticum]|uniref:Uncharacterized protein n=1 Tax=Flavobacterium aquaticum TaxID=1236486 RepID=A0A327YQ18_9FLAO|nr:hypothetical protein B0I03_105201 [Flavobacterium aquaticum]
MKFKTFEILISKIINFIRNLNLAFLISILYVGLGTFTVCSVYGSDTFYGEWTVFALLVTFPVSIISFGYRYAEPNSFLPVFIIQFIMFIITFLILSSLIKNKTLR